MINYLASGKRVIPLRKLANWLMNTYDASVRSDSSQPEEFTRVSSY